MAIASRAEEVLLDLRPQQRRAEAGRARLAQVWFPPTEPVEVKHHGHHWPCRGGPPRPPLTAAPCRGAPPRPHPRPAPRTVPRCHLTRAPVSSPRPASCVCPGVVGVAVARVGEGGHGSTEQRINTQSEANILRSTRLRGN
jgi:hypothetical protein